MSHRKGLILAIFLGTLVAATIGVGIYLHHYFVVTVFGIWLGVEYFFRRWSLLKVEKLSFRVNFYGIPQLLSLFENLNEFSREQITDRVARIQKGEVLSVNEKRWLNRYQYLVELKSLIRGYASGRNSVFGRAFLYLNTPVKLEAGELLPQWHLQDVIESATRVSELYWKLFDAATGKYPHLEAPARSLYEEIFGEEFVYEKAKSRIEKLTDLMQRDDGLSFLVLNLIRSEAWDWAKIVTKELLLEEERSGLEEEMRSALYWISEITWFAKERPFLIEDHDSSLRYIYHLCFTYPDRAGFLEIDSRYFSQFQEVNDIAREGFLFKEILIEKILAFWEGVDPLFNDVFQSVVEQMTRENNKIYDDRKAWQAYWSRAKGSFLKEYLNTVEGNVCFALGRYQEAETFYQKALEQDPNFGPAYLNLIFVYAKLGNKSQHEAWVEKLLKEKTVQPSVHLVIGDSYLLIGERAKAEEYYQKLRENPEWQDKVDFYISTFCYEHGHFAEALEFAEVAVQKAPYSEAIRYHLSQCCNAVGQKDRALWLLNEMEGGPKWLDFYRFTLQRDSGRVEEASETLLTIPSDYFQDPEELEEALSFAKSRADLVLLRHLKKS